MNIDKAAEKIESIKEKIESLNYGFSIDSRADANIEIQNALEALDRWLEIAEEDEDRKDY